MSIHKTSHVDGKDVYLIRCNFINRRGRKKTISKVVHGTYEEAQREEQLLKVRRVFAGYLSYNKKHTVRDELLERLQLYY